MEGSTGANIKLSAINCFLLGTGIPPSGHFTYFRAAGQGHASNTKTIYSVNSLSLPASVFSGRADINGWTFLRPVSAYGQVCGDTQQAGKEFLFFAIAHFLKRILWQRTLAHWQVPQFSAQSKLAKEPILQRLFPISVLFCEIKTPYPLVISIASQKMIKLFEKKLHLLGKKINMKI